MIGDKLGNVLDSQWLERTQEQNEKQAEKLDVDLCQHKLNSIKEKVRMGHNDLGNHYYAVGNLNEALKCFMRTRDYGTSTKHTIDMCLSIIRVSIEMGNFSHVINYVTKAETQPEQPTDLGVVAKLRAAAGLAHLDGCKYKQAALKFTQMKIEVGKENNQPIIKNIHPDELCYSDVIAPQDVAIYGGLCALATFDRTELASKVLSVSPTLIFIPVLLRNAHVCAWQCVEVGSMFPFISLTVSHAGDGGQRHETVPGAGARRTRNHLRLLSLALFVVSCAHGKNPRRFTPRHVHESARGEALRYDSLEGSHPILHALCVSADADDGAGIQHDST